MHGGINFGQALALVLASSPALAEPLPAAVAQKTPAAVVILVDRARVLRESDAGKYLSAEAEALTRSSDANFSTESKKIDVDQQRLQKMPSPTGGGDDRLAQLRELHDRRLAVQAQALKRTTAIESERARAIAQIETAMLAVIEEIMKERGANLVIDAGLGVVGSGIDVTNAVVSRLNTKLPNATSKLSPRPSDND